MSRRYVPATPSAGARIMAAGTARPGLLLGLLGVGQLWLLSAAAAGSQPLLTIMVGVHAFDSLVIALGAVSLSRSAAPLELLGRLRYFLHACGTACGVHYAVRLACRLGVGWASDRWGQLHAGAGASGLLVTFGLREVVAGLFLCARVDPTKPNPLLGACLAKESLLVGGGEFSGSEQGDTLVYRAKKPRCGLGLGTQFTVLTLLVAAVSLIRHPPSVDGAEGGTGAAPLLFGVLGSILCTHMHQLLRKFCIKSSAALRRAQLFFDNCASTCWLLGCAAAETVCGGGGGGASDAKIAGVSGEGGRTFGEIYAASHPAAVVAGGQVEMWTLIELIEHGLSGGTAGIAPPHESGAAMCAGPMIATFGSEAAGGAGDGNGGGMAGWLALTPLLVPSVLLPLLFAAVRCDAVTGSGGANGAPPGSKGLKAWCCARGPTGLPRGAIVGGFQMFFIIGTQGALILGSRHPVAWSAAPIPPYMLEAAAFITLFLHLVMVCSDPDPARQSVSGTEVEDDPVEALLQEDRRRRTYNQSAAQQHKQGKVPTSPSPGSSAVGAFAAAGAGGGPPCQLCGLERGGEHRGYHCAVCGRCVALRDHHCEWVGTCIGRNNTLTFICMCATMLSCLIGGCIDLGSGLWLLYCRSASRMPVNTLTVSTHKRSPEYTIHHF